ncbi:kelch repeat-containing protein [Cohnella cholangitidis]|uniref:DUF5050 domain-containing protein n=1 Tax=Cohnella cholangitidis TaxID=2598458 RepID=A0A7G5C1G4_9BACL|nr:kelch repeat-containing protein [Cohnella cholangitidis]QMV43048.1 DUF5050 domain-containing protein [Cohnella cholangitidis]
MTTMKHRYPPLALTLRILLILSVFSAILTPRTDAATNPSSNGSFQALSNLPSALSALYDPIPLSGNRVLFLSAQNLFTYDANNNRWTTMKISGIAKASAIAKINDDKVMLIGGLDANGITYKQNVIFDLRTQKATPAAELPGAMAGYVNMDAASLPNGKILVIGYFNVNAINENFVYLYDPSTEEWTEPAALAYVGSTLTVNKQGDVLNTGSKAGEFFSHGQLYRAKNDQFSTTSMMPSPISYPSVVAMNDGNFLHAGGSDGGNTTIHPTSKAFIFQVDNNYWQSISPMKTARYFSAAASLPNGKVLVAGGKGSDHKWINATEVYDPSTDQWSPGPAMNYQYGSLVSIPLDNGNTLFMGSLDGKLRAELLVWDDKLPVDKPGEASSASGKKLSGKEVGYKTLFREGEWTYKTVYTLESAADFRFGENGISYTRKYLVREQAGKAREIVLDGNFQFLLNKDGILYYLENSYLKKLQLDGNNPYGEFVRFADDIYRKLQFSETSHMLAKYAGQTASFGMTDFDGTYVYSWYTIPSGFGNKGYPIRYKYDGSELEKLSTIPGQGRLNKADRLQLAGDYLVYTRVPSSMNYNDAAEAKKVTIHSVKKDGSAEKDIAVAASFDVYRGKVYYGDMGQKPVNGQYGYKIYSVNPDGTDKKLLSSEGQSSDLYFNGDRIIFQNNKGDKIFQMNLDGSNQQIIRQGTAKTSYRLQKASAKSIVYHKSQNGKWVGNYQLNLETMKETLVQAPPK